MAVPPRKKSKAKRRSRRAQHDRITLPNIAICENCGADMLSHHACPSCGYYRGRVAVVIAAETEAVEEAEE
ncbi:MAG: 50S ribosomal protein L32 [Deltaproteobacteria bacterium]|nr:MAG: 50S ribosomal protein L32 [Deltaproteobacteria bacterium]